MQTGFSALPDRMICVRMLFELIRGWGYLLAFISGGCFIRRARLQRGRNVTISPTAFFKFPENVKIGNNTFINHLCSIWASPEGPITIGSGVLLGPCTQIISSNHGYAAGTPIRGQAGMDAPIDIGDDVWLGANVVVTPGVSIGRGCVVGAGAVVTKDLPAMSICVGVPARPIAFRDAVTAPAILAGTDSHF
jgi:maltose O-acetyltransferase